MGLLHANMLHIVRDTGLWWILHSSGSRIPDSKAQGLLVQVSHLGL